MLLGQILERVFLAFGVFVLVAGCTPQQERFAVIGIGANLATPHVERLTKLEEHYFNYLCDQSGLNDRSGSNKASACIKSLGLVNDDWTYIVHQGMNDIDRRCDQFLQWMDEQRRIQTPLLAQINDIGSATNAILNVTSANEPTISIVAQAFGLLTKSLQNYQDLLVNIEGSTINSVVINQRHNFRKATANFVYSTRPAAEYALRSYLRICLPFAIKTEVNDYSTLRSRPHKLVVKLVWF